MANTTNAFNHLQAMFKQKQAKQPVNAMHNMVAPAPQPVPIHPAPMNQPQAHPASPMVDRTKFAHIHRALNKYLNRNLV